MSGVRGGGTKRSRSQLMEVLARELRGYQSALDVFDDVVAARLSINRTDLRCLDILSARGSLTAGELARLAGLSSGAMTFALDRMEKMGFVTRKREEVDRRHVQVCMTELAQKLGWSLHEPLVTEMRAAARAFGLAELEAVRSFLSLARQLYEKHSALLRQVDEDLAPPSASEPS